MNVLLIEPNPNIKRRILKQFEMNKEISTVQTYSGLNEGIEDKINDHINIVFMDYHTNDIQYMDFIVHLVQNFPRIQIVLMRSDTIGLEDSKISEIKFISKPFDQSTLEELLRRIKKYQRVM